MLLPVPGRVVRRKEGIERKAIIGANDDLGIAATLVGCSVLGRRLGAGPLVALGGPVTTMALSFGLSTSHFLETQGATAVNSIRDASVQLATPCMLLDADARELKSGAGPLLGAFFIAAVATTVGALCAFRLTRRHLFHALGSDGAKVAAALAAKNIGGGLNFAAVATFLTASPQAQISALCCDNVMALLYFPLCNFFAGTQPPVEEAQTTTPRQKIVVSGESDELTTTSAGLLDALFLALLVLFLSARLAPSSARLPTATGIALTFALLRGFFFKSKQNFRTKRPATVLADTLLYVFFAGAGAAGGSLTQAFRDSGPPLMAFLLILYLGHFAVLSLAFNLISALAPNESTTIRRRRRARFAVASNAAIGGPATAAALCTSKNWRASTTPAVCVGTLGYATASFIGIFLHGLWSTGLSSLLGPILSCLSSKRISF